MPQLFDPKASKKPTNLTVNSDLLRIARDLGINISATLEESLTEKVRQQARSRWIEENQSAIAAYNAHVEENGVFSDEFRSF